MPLFRGLLLAGSTLSNREGRCGVAGLKVVDQRNHEYILTCAHVVAPPWDEVTGASIDCPATLAGPPGSSVFGQLFTWSRLRVGFELEVDAALIKPLLDVRLTNQNLRLPPPDCRVMPDLRAFQSAPGKATRVRICTGRGPVQGTIVDFTRKEIVMRNSTYSFPTVLEYVADVQEGDSGSAVLDPRTNAVIGLHFAGDRPRQGYCIPVDVILTFFPGLTLRIPA